MVSLLSAFLLVFTPASVLDDAMREASAAIESESKIICIYRMTSKAEGHPDATMRFAYEPDGENSRYDMSMNGETVVKYVQFEGKSTTVYPTRRSYSEAPTAKMQKSEEPIRPGLNQFNFSVLNGTRLYLLSNPPFFNFSEASETIEGKKVRKIRFETFKARGEGKVVGSASFDDTKRFLLAADLVFTGKNPATMEIKLEKIQLAAPINTRFLIDPSEITGFERMELPEESRR